MQTIDSFLLLKGSHDLRAVPPWCKAERGGKYQDHCVIFSSEVKTAWESGHLFVTPGDPSSAAKGVQMQGLPNKKALSRAFKNIRHSEIRRK